MLRFKRLHEVGAVLLGFGAAAALGCVGNADSSSVHGALTGIGDGKAHTIQITPPTTTVLRGASASFQCLATDSRGVVISTSPSWTIADPGVAAISTNGTVTGTRGGTTVASCMVDGTAGSATVTVIDSPVSFLEVTPGADALVIGSTAQLVGTPRDSSGAAIQGYPVQWTTADTGIATVSASGQVLARAEGTATVTATSGGQVSYAKIAVSKTPPVPVATVTISISSATLNVGQTAHAIATTTDASGNVLTGRAVAWSSSNPSVASVIGTSANKANVVGRAIGTTTLTATSEGMTGSLTVTVGSAPVQTVTVQLASSTILPGQTTQATATLTDALGNALTGRTVTWSSLDPTIATVSTTGVVTAVASGAVIIRATSEGQTGDATLTVGVDPVSTVSVTLGSANLAPGQTTQATAVVRDATGNVLNGRTIAWSSLSPSDASVSIAGVVTGVSAGSTTIRATVESTTGDAPITIASTAPSTPTPASVVVTFDSTQIATGHSAQAHAVAKDATGNVISGLTPSWTSKATGIATVSSSGLVTGVSAGAAGIQATISGITGQSSITVYTTTSTTRPDSVSLVLDAGSYASGSYAVEATTTLINAASVQFIVDGALYRTETIAKYCLFGGDASCASGSLGAGAHTIQAKVINSAGTLLGVSAVLNIVDGSTSSPAPTSPTPTSPSPTPTGVVDLANFEDGTLGSFYDFNPTMHAVSVVNDPLNSGHGKVAKIHYNIQTSGSNQDDNEGIATGVPNIGLGSEFWFSGDFLIPAGSDMVNVQRKLVYWGWSRDTWGFQQPFQFDFKAFGAQFCMSNIPWNPADTLVSQPGVGSGQRYIDPKVAYLTAGVWHHLMIHMKINSSFTAADGIQEITYDGTMIFSDHTMQWTNPAWDPVANPPSTYQWVFWQIGQQADASVTTVEDRYWDNVMFSRSPLP